MNPTPDNTCISIAVVGGDRYIIVYRESQRIEACRVALRWSHDPDLSLDFVDALQLCQQIQQATVAKVQFAAG